MKTKYTVAVALLGAVLAAPSIAMAEDVISDATLNQVTSQSAYDTAVARRAARVQGMQGKFRAVDDSAQRLRDEAFQPGGVGG